MPEEIVSQEQMEMFNQGRTEQRPPPPPPSPRRMAEAPMEQGMSDTGLRRDDPRLAFAAFATFLVDLRPEKINQMKTFVMNFPLVTDAVSETLQMAPEELNDLFNASLGDPEANQRMLQKFGGEEAMATEEPMQPQPQPQMPMQAEQPPAQAQEQMPMQAEQPRFERGGVQVRGAGISEKLAKSAESSTLAVLNETENEDEALTNYGKMQDLALEAGLTMDEVYRMINVGNERAKQSFLDEGGSRLTIAKKFLPFTKAWKYSAKIRAIEKGSKILGNKIEKEIDDVSDNIESFFENFYDEQGLLRNPVGVPEGSSYADRKRREEREKERQIGGIGIGGRGLASPQ